MREEKSERELKREKQREIKRTKIVTHTESKVHWNKRIEQSDEAKVNRKLYETQEKIVPMTWVANGRMKEKVSYIRYMCSVAIPPTPRLHIWCLSSFSWVVVHGIILSSNSKRELHEYRVTEYVYTFRFIGWCCANQTLSNVAENDEEIYCRLGYSRAYLLWYYAGE